MDLPLRRAGDYRRTVASLREATLSSAIARYRRMKLLSGRWRESSARIYDHEMRMVLEILRDRPVAEVSTEDIEVVWVSLSGGGYSPQWIERVRCDLSGLFAWLLRHRAVKEDPTTIWEPTEIDEDDHDRVYHDFTREEMTRLTAPAPLPLWRFSWIAVYTGLRRGSIYSLRVGWVDPDAWICHLPATAFKQRRGHRVPLHPAIRGLLDLRQDPESPLIPGLPHRDTIGDQLKACARAAGIPEKWAYPHQFRRTFCAWAKAAGMSRQEAMDILGSRSESVLIRHYWPRTEDEELRSSIEKI